MGAAERKIGEWQNPIVNEADRPNRSAQNMKEIFDSNTNELKEALNGLIDDLLAGDCAEAFEVAGARANIQSGDTLAVIFGKLAKFYLDAQTALNTVHTGGQSTRYLSEDGTYTTPAAGEAINGVVMGGSLGNLYVKASETDYDAVWVSPQPGLVGAPKMVTEEQEIETADWSASGDGYEVTVTVTGMDAEACVVVGCDEASREVWMDCGIRGVSQDEGEVTLYADNLPEESVTAHVFALWNAPSIPGVPGIR